MIFHKRPFTAGVMLSAIILLCPPRLSYAIVGKAEQYDEFKAEDLSEFHENLTNEELKEQLERSDALAKALKKKEKESEELTDEEKTLAEEEINALRTELLQLPKRDKFSGELTGSYRYTSNVDRARIHSEKGDSVFKTIPGLNIDLSGRKTDLRMSLEGNRTWNIKRDASDEYEIGESLSYRRKYFKKLNHSVKSRVARHNSKTIEINKDKIRWDFDESSAYNLPLTRKLSLNSSLGGSKRLFPQEAFDSDSAWEFTSSPSLFWNFTPKSRVSLGYEFGANRIRSKAGDANQHGIQLGYFGKITRKSSTSLDLTFNHQSPRSFETGTVNTVTAGLGYIWQMTAKTQMTVQLIRSMQNTTSNLISGDVEGDSVTEKQDIHYTNNSVSYSINSRLTRKLTAVLAVTPSLATTHTDATRENEEDENTQITLPVSISATYPLTRQASLNVGYTFSYRRADEKADEHRVHQLDTSLRMVV